MNSKKKLILHILKSGDKTVTSLIKICYLIDLLAIRKLDEQISDFEYIRYNYGPFDKTIYSELLELQKDGLIKSCNMYSTTGGDGEHVVIYGINDNVEIVDDFNENQLNIINDLLPSLQGYGPKYLTELAYKTNPMDSIGATLGGVEHMGEKLNMRA